MTGESKTSRNAPEIIEDESLDQAAGGLLPAVSIQSKPVSKLDTVALGGNRPPPPPPGGIVTVKGDGSV